MDTPNLSLLYLAVVEVVAIALRHTKGLQEDKNPISIWTSGETI